ncbi:MAG TPA: BREX-2 system adenine-specific DNA-methyltransferase PglX, partial [Candidatus Tectomicrobia bacterium]|nr:BREX-2 system adenine-specific DNA-methyltransferase PglX [Candidatus Tectomicrobia bacterium]
FGDQSRLDKRREGIGHAYCVEDLTELNRILGQQYHVVVGNPPYITVKDRALNQAYRNRFSTCHRQYSLVVPFVERFLELAIYGHDAQPAGYVGMITANSFMKREFGKKLIEVFFPRADLTHVIDTSGAYIPGHGTPTVILFGRDRPSVGPTVRAVLGIRGEPSTPADPAQGQVWQSIVDLVDHSGAQNDFVSVTDVPRQTFAKHPWSVGGGGIADIKSLIEAHSSRTLMDIVDLPIGRAVRIAQEEVLMFNEPRRRYSKCPMSEFRGFLLGEAIRDWSSAFDWWVWYPYSEGSRESDMIRQLWCWRTVLANRATFQGIMADAGLQWYEYMQHTASAYHTPLSIAFAFVATHNHFVLDRGGKVFKQSAPIIKLPADATEEDHLALLGLLNSSTACFWMKQVCAGKHKGDGGQAHADPAYQRFEFDGTKLQRFPLALEKPLNFGIELDRLARERQAHLPAQLAVSFPLSRAALNEHKRQAEALLGTMIALQEELDWRCYTLYGITNQDLCYRDSAGNQREPPELALGQRAFEIVMARRVAAAELETTWFERHGSKPITDLPDYWPEDYKRLVERRIALIEREPYINLIERPEYKRRWNTEPWEEQERRALRNWLLDRLEDSRYWQEPSLQTTRTLANKAQKDADFLQVAELYRGHAGFDVHALVAELVEAESVPFLPVLRYKPLGLRKREIWERTWDLQRREDTLNAEVAATVTRRADETLEQFQERLVAEQRRRKREEVGDIPPPPKYTSADFLTSTCWRLRGALDVPKERFISLPFCSRDADPSLLIGWAGWDHLQQAKALAAWYTEVVEQEGWSTERLKPLLAGLAELIPWLKQWHNDLDAEFHELMGDFFEIFLQGQLQRYGLIRDDLRGWTPPALGRPRRSRQRS